jgi:hypothetical protein
MCLFISKLFGVVAAAVEGNVDCEEQVSHFDFLLGSFFSSNPSEVWANEGDIERNPIFPHNRGAFINHQCGLFPITRFLFAQKP